MRNYQEFGEFGPCPGTSPYLAVQKRMAIGFTTEVRQVVACASDKAREADADARTAERIAENISRLVAPLTELRRTGEEMNHAYKVLKDLSAALKPGAFPKWLTLRRSRALLIHASRLLEQMSGGRYTLAELYDENAEWRPGESRARRHAWSDRNPGKLAQPTPTRPNGYWRS